MQRIEPPASSIFQEVETLPDELVEAWDRSWLLIDSATAASAKRSVTTWSTR